MKKVIEQELFPNIEILLDDFGHIEISQLCINSLLKNPTVKEDLISVENNSRTTVAKAICPQYQEVEESYTKLLEALNRLLEYGDRMVELYRDSVEKIKSDDGKTEDVKIFQMRLSQGKFYGWRDSMKFLREAIQQSETK